MGPELASISPPNSSSNIQDRAERDAFTSIGLDLVVPLKVPGALDLLHKVSNESLVTKSFVVLVTSQTSRQGF